jgi:hypothetical protein
MGEMPTDLVARTRLYRAGRLEKDDFPVEDLSEFLAEPDTVLWVDLCEPDATDLEVVARELGLHTLAVEDAVDARCCQLVGSSCLFRAVRVRRSVVGAGPGSG